MLAGGNSEPELERAGRRTELVLKHAPRMLPPMLRAATWPLRYLAEMTAPRTILWCYLIWWLYTVAHYFDPAPRLWLSSLGISAIIGTALYLSTAHGGRGKTALDRWQIIRLYIMPFCVSSFAALIKDRGFILVFHPTLRANLIGLGLCALFCVLAGAARLGFGRRSRAAEHSLHSRAG